MPLLIYSLLGGLLSILGSAVGRILLQLGLSFVIFSGINVGFDYLKSEVIGNMQSLGGDVMQLLAFLWVDKAISLVMSAYAAAVALKMAGGTTITKLVRK
jgi:hypothetical protein